MGTGLIFIILGFTTSVALLFGLVYYLTKQSEIGTDAELIKQVKQNPLQKKAMGKDLRLWIPLLLIGGLVSVSAATVFVFSNTTLMESINRDFKALWEIEANSGDLTPPNLDDPEDEPPPEEPPPPPPPRPPPPPSPPPPTELGARTQDVTRL